MKLTNYIRDAFVRSVMKDVPYTDHSDQAFKLIETAVEEVFDKQFGAGKFKALRKEGWLVQHYMNTPAYLDSRYVPFPGGCDEFKIAFPETWAQIEKLAKLAEEQQKVRNKLEESIRAAAYSVTTRKALAELLPEFEKYLPADDAKAIKINLPAVANIVADFTRAGWPKQKETAEV